ncbi:unnamed protein product [Cylicocyclus nassatus]|uniref:Uncharacterized protein n=1 Tax=Cylicocyclus nassatus TaxID=53992 RepID=A0AA36DKV3_CYLNA|nr:unnamed protein product [Cylicocyclus nassatus]
MVPTSLSLMLLFSLEYYIVADQCYVGDDTFEALNVTIPICSFKIAYNNDCSAQPKVVLAEGPATQIVNFNNGRNSICYFEEMHLLCYCRGHLCNDDNSIKEILARELANGASGNLKKLVACFLLHADDGEGYIRQRLRGEEEPERQLRPLPMSIKKSPPEGKNGKNKPRNDWFLFIAGAAVVIIFADLILLFLIFFLVLKKRRLKNAGEKSNSNTLSKKSLDTHTPQYPFPEFSGREGSNILNVSDAEGVKRIEEVIKREEEEEQS